MTDDQIERVKLRGEIIAVQLVLAILLNTSPPVKRALETVSLEDLMLNAKDLPDALPQLEADMLDIVAESAQQCLDEINRLASDAVTISQK